MGLAACTSRVEPPPAPPPPQQITVVGVGDILLGRKLAVEMQTTGDYALPFQNIAPLLTQADVAFGNLEGVFCEKRPWPTDGMVFRIRPEAVKSLIAGGIDVVSIANNHFGDGGDACMTFSFAHLRANGIAAAGAGANYDEAHAPAIIERKGVKFAFLAYTYADRNDKKDVVTGFSPAPSPTPSASLKAAATKAKPAQRPVIAGRNPENVRRDVEAALQQADVVIVSLHDGAEYLQRVAKETEQFAHAAIDAGATAVLGHHPHVPQRVEHYKDGWIFYSLGNFVFQQNTPPAVKHALIARLTFNGKSLVQVEALPAYIETFARPRLATPEEAAKILGGIGIKTSILWKASDTLAP